MIQILETSQSNCMLLYEFYFEKASETERRRFSPYQLFNDPVTGADIFEREYSDWQKKTDWMLTVAYSATEIIGIGFVKRMSTEATSGVLVLDE
jgi:hypothetical protein